MKFTCLQENLAKGINIVTRAIPAKSSLPVLANVLILAEKGRVKLTATNLETYITTFINASVEEEGAITIPAKTLKEFVANLSPSTISVRLSDDILHLSSDKTKSKMNGISAKEYPELPNSSVNEKHIELDPKVFSSTVALVAFAAGLDESRPIFTGVYLKYSTESKTLIVASTDGFRLSEKTLATEADSPDFSTIIPAKTISEVARIFSNSTEPVKFSVNEEGNLALFSSEDTFVATRVLDGQYPDYKRIIPTQSVIKVEFDSADFHEAVRLTHIFTKDSKDNAGPIKLRFDRENGIRVSSLATETGEHESVVQADIEGEAIEVAFSAKYLLDFLNNVKSPKLVFLTNGNSSPCIVKPSDSLDFVHIIMPVQL